VKHAFPWSLALAGPSLPVHVAWFPEAAMLRRRETAFGASKPEGVRTVAQAMQRKLRPQGSEENQERTTSRVLVGESSGE